MRINHVFGIAVLTTSLAVSALSVGCSSDSTPAESTPGTTAPATTSQAADLRTTLNLLLGEHQILAAKTTAAALGGRTDEYTAYANLLNENGTTIGGLITTAFGAAAGAMFNQIWSAHDGFFVDYTTAVAMKDTAKQQAAVNSLMNTYVPQFAAFISGATGLPEATVTTLTQEHVGHTKDIVDDQAASNWAKEYTDIRAAFAHMQMIADPLSEAIAAKLQAAFPGDPKNPGVDFRVALNKLLQEHMFLATFATGAALGGRSDEFTSAGKALNDNGTDIGAAVGSLFGTAAQASFNQIWSAHDGFFVDYTTGVATMDMTKEQAAVNNLMTVYLPQFSMFIAGASGLPETTVSDLTKMHITTTKDVVDAQGAKNFADASAKDLTATHHMQMIGDPLSEAIVAKLPEKFQ